MATPEVSYSPPPHDERLFRQLDGYPWDTDVEFQGGLRAILGPNPDPERAEQLTLHARCFYYSRHATPQHSLDSVTNKKPGNTTFQLISRPTIPGIRSTHPALLPTALPSPSPPLPLNPPSSPFSPKYHQLKPTPTPSPLSRTLPLPFFMAPHPPPPPPALHQRHRPPLILPLLVK